MELIKMRGIEKYFGGKLLFTFDKLTVFKNDIIGVVGLTLLFHSRLQSG